MRKKKTLFFHSKYIQLVQSYEVRRKKKKDVAPGVIGWIATPSPAVKSTYVAPRSNKHDTNSAKPIALGVYAAPQQCTSTRQAFY